MPRKSLDIRTTDYPCYREKGLTALFPACGEDGSGQGPDNGSRDGSLVGVGARPQGLKLPISAIFKVLLSLFFSARFFIDYLTLPQCQSVHKDNIYYVSKTIKGDLVCTSYYT
jgi:hypothetical protein